MKRKRVSSTCLSGVGHDAEKKRLEVQFKKSGAVYQYRGVSKRVAGNLVKASSVGRHFVRNVRNEYGYTKISGGSRKRARGKRGK